MRKPSQRNVILACVYPLLSIRLVRTESTDGWSHETKLCRLLVSLHLVHAFDWCATSTSMIGSVDYHRGDVPNLVLRVYHSYSLFASGHWVTDIAWARGSIAEIEVVHMDAKPSSETVRA